MNKNTGKLNPGWLFLAGMLVIYFLVFLISPESFYRILPRFVILLKKMLPVLLGVYVLMFLVNLLLKPKKVIRYLGKESGLKGILISSAAGVISVGPIYVWYPLLSDLRDKGMTNNLITIFLYNRAVKIPLLPMMFYYFGLNFTITLTILMILFAVLNGWLVEKVMGIGVE